MVHLAAAVKPGNDCHSRMKYSDRAAPGAMLDQRNQTVDRLPVPRQRRGSAEGSRQKPPGTGGDVFGHDDPATVDPLPQHDLDPGGPGGPSMGVEDEAPVRDTSPDRGDVV